jgi:hypothetical protein
MSMLFRPNRNLSRATVLALVACTSCDFLVDPPLPPDAQQFAPPPIYARWWAMVESCSGLKRPLDNVQWYATPGALLNPHNSAEPVEGYWSLASNRIVLASNDTVDGSVVRHEMLHALLRAAGHPRSAFLQNCGGVVDCSPQCVLDGGPIPRPDPAIPTVTPSELEVTSSVSPSSPGSSVDGGFATFTISVHNPFPHPVIALLPLPFTGGIASSYLYSIRQMPGGGVSSGDMAFDTGVTYFSAGETKHIVYDFVDAPVTTPSYNALPGLGDQGITLPPGTYQFRGAYGDHWAADLIVVLSP